MPLILVQKDRVTTQVFEAIEDRMYLEVGVKNLLEMLDEGDDGIFKNTKAWRAFLFGNFAEYAEKGTFWLEGECKESTIKKWCYDLEQYKGRFVQAIGGGKYCWVDPNDLEFTFEFDANFYKHIPPAKLPCRVEIYVTARIKED